MGVWARAVVVPAGRRVAAVWAASGLIGGQLFGGRAMHPHDLTGLALGHPIVGLGLGLTWLLVFLPTARVLVRQDGARWLRSLPGPTVAPALVAAAALIGLQAPWLALWVIGEGARGALIVGAQTIVLAAVARTRAPVGRRRPPRWRGPVRGLAGVHARALVRRAGDALVRGLGLGVMAGVAAGLFVANNQLAGQDAAVVGGSVIAIVIVPAVAGPLLVLLDSHRQSRWLAASMGVSEELRLGVLAGGVVALYAASTAIALAAASLIARPSGWIIAVALGMATGCGLAVTRLLASAGETTRVAARSAIGAFAVACAAVVAVGTLGVSGVGLVVAGGLVALLVRR